LNSHFEKAAGWNRPPFSIGIPTTVEKTSSFCHSEKPDFDDTQFTEIRFVENWGLEIERPVPRSIHVSVYRNRLLLVSSFFASAKLVVGDQHHPHYY